MFYVAGARLRPSDRLLVRVLLVRVLLLRRRRAVRADFTAATVRFRRVLYAAAFHRRTFVVGLLQDRLRIFESWLKIDKARVKTVPTRFPRPGDGTRKIQVHFFLRSIFYFNGFRRFPEHLIRMYVKRRLIVENISY